RRPSRSRLRPYTTLFRSVQIQPHDRLQLFHELRIVAELEGLHQMRLEAVGMPNAADAGFTQPHSGGHRPGAPVRGVTWFLLSRRSEEHTSELQSRENLVC